jgi:copper(I)-binding protein
VILSSRAAPLRVLAMVVAAAVAPVIAGCEAGFNAPTQQWHQPAAGASAVVNNVLRINNVFVLGAAPAFSLPRGGSAGLFLAITNEGVAPDRLIGVTAPGTAAAVQLPAGGVRLAGQQQVLLSGPAPRVILRRLIRSVNGGQHILVVLHFVRAGNVTMAVPVMPRAQWFSTFSPAPLLVSPSPSPTGTASPSPSGTSPSPSPSATG